MAENSEFLYELDETNEVVDLLLLWGLSIQSIYAVLGCGIKELQLLKILHTHDIDEIFKNLPREYFAEKIIFRHELQKWRANNNVSICVLLLYLLCIFYWQLQALSCCASDITVSNSKSSCNVEPCVTSVWPSAGYDIKNLLEKTVSGADIIRKYEENKTLTDLEQNTVSRIVVEYFIKNEIKMDATIMASAAKSIVLVFPFENHGTYYIPRTSKKNASGKIYDRYYNQKHKLKTPKRAKVTENFTCSEVSIVELDDGEFLTKKKWLSHNIPSDLKSVWQETSHIRMKENKESVDEMFRDWPRYKDANGLELIDIDFETIHPGKTYLLINKIDDLEKDVSNMFFPKGVKDKLNLQFLENYRSAKNISKKISNYQLIIYFC